MSEEIFYDAKVKRTKKKSSTKNVKSELYRGVTLRITKDGRERWIGRMVSGNSKPYDTEREAAIAVDMSYINAGLEPINILKRKT
jgi:hypothetical protein